MTATERDGIAHLQGGRCAICQRGGLRLELDHDHRHCPGRTGCRQCIRGLLCARCNAGLGLIGDAAVPRLLAYLAAAASAIHTARYWADVNVVIVSPSLKQSGEILGRARTGLRRLGVELEQDSASVLRLTNGSRIVSLPGTARSVRGWTARLLVVDEAAFVEPETFVAARALVATGGRLVVQSTPAGEFGDFHEIVRTADPTWAHFTIRSDEVPTISPAFLAAERRAMTPDAFASEYECAFGKSGAALFSQERIAALVMPSGAPA